LIGLLADLIGFNRKMLEEVVYRLRSLEIKEQQQPSGNDQASQDRGG
jgi:hypothetical protein